MIKWVKIAGVGDWPAVHVAVDYSGRVSIAQDDGNNGPDLYSWAILHLDQWAQVCGAVEREIWNRRHELTQFMSSYIEAALWSTTDESDESGGVPMDHNYCEDDIHPDSLKAIEDDCIAFLNECGGYITDESSLRSNRIMSDGTAYSPMELAGHDFWFTRCGHGVGFWETDRWREYEGEKLTAASKRAGEVWLYVGDDGKIHQG